MLTYSQAFYQLQKQLQSLYDAQEATAICHEVLQHITGADKIRRLLQKDTLFTPEQQTNYDKMTTELATGKPLQYVLGIAWFMGKEYKVNEDVLIPRPETEELMQWIIDDNKTSNQAIHIIDIGTGSGCISISLKLALPQAIITTCDVSPDALAVARENSKSLGADISFIELNFLDDANWDQLNTYDIIVSNPPYIPAAEQVNMHINVTAHEPSLALFVPDDNPLIFYKAIAKFGKGHLSENGCIYCELDADHAVQTKELFESEGYQHVTLKKDIHSNIRMLKAMRA